MGIEVGGVLGLILLGLVIWAIIHVVGSATSPGGKVLWTGIPQLESIHAEKMSRSRPIGNPLATDGRQPAKWHGERGPLIVAASDTGFDTTFETHRSRDRPAVIGLPTVMPMPCAV
jgi:hypothetical protein